MENGKEKGYLLAGGSNHHSHEILYDIHDPLDHICQMLNMYKKIKYPFKVSAQEISSIIVIIIRQSIQCFEKQSFISDAYKTRIQSFH